ncbi:MAG: YhbY family RNA-binding protein [Limisphaerales bacterium]
MTALPLPGPLLRRLKPLAPHLDPVVRLGKAGLSDAFHAALDRALLDHELVKLRFDHLKEQKKPLALAIAARAGAAIVQQVGNVLVLYRPQPDPAKRRFEAPGASADSDSPTI